MLVNLFQASSVHVLLIILINYLPALNMLLCLLSFDLIIPLPICLRYHYHMCMCVFIYFNFYLTFYKHKWTFTNLTSQVQLWTQGTDTMSCWNNKLQNLSTTYTVLDSALNNKAIKKRPQLKPVVCVLKVTADNDVQSNPPSSMPWGIMSTSWQPHIL